MREIKFRAWDGEAMYPHNEVGDLFWFEYTADGLTLAIEEQHFESGSGVAVEQWRTINVPAEFMQYTGLKDKTSREIYEGDIVRLSHNKHYWIYEITTASEQFGNALFAILIEDNLSSTEDGEKYTFNKRFFNKSSRRYIPSGGNCEVIGNIYENPELL